VRGTTFPGFEINAHFAAARQFDAGLPFFVVQQRAHRVRHALGRVVVVVVHIDNDFAARLFVHHVALLAEGNLFVQSVVFHARMLRHEVLHGVGAVVNDDPLHAVARVRLVVEALQHGGNERAAVERGRAHADKWMHCLMSSVVCRR
jgi:hypothetical protein